MAGSNDQGEVTLTALVHAVCGHAAAVDSGEAGLEATRRQAGRLGLTEPDWTFTQVDVADAVDRFFDGPCDVCRIIQ